MSPKAFTQEERMQVRRRLVDGARTALFTAGVAKTPVSALCAAAGISKGAFYQFYENKETLFLDALEAEQQLVHDQLLAAMPRPVTAEAFTQILGGFYRQASSYPWLRTMTAEVETAMMTRVRPERVARHIALDDLSARRLVERLDPACRLDPGLLSAVLRALFLTVLHRREVGPRAEEAFDFLLRAAADALFGKEAL